MTGKERLQGAADALFAEQGFSAVSVAQILEAAEVQAPTLYHHFGDKEGLFVEWAERAFEELRPHLEAVVCMSDPLEALAAYLHRHFVFAKLDLDRTLRDAETMARPESRERILAAYLRAVFEPLVALLAGAIARGQARDEPVHRLADAFLSGGLALRPHLGAEDSATIAGWWAGVFYHGIAKRTIGRPGDLLK